MLADYPFNPIHIFWIYPLILLIYVGLPLCLIYCWWRAVARNRSRRRFLSLPHTVAQKVSTFPESSFGEHRVTLVLSDSRKISQVIITSGAIKSVGRKYVSRPEDVDFDVKNIVDVCHA